MLLFHEVCNLSTICLLIDDLFWRFARASKFVTDFNTRNKLLTQKFLKQGIRYHKFTEPFLNFIDDTMI